MQSWSSALSGAASRRKGAAFQRLIRSWFEGQGFEPMERPPGEEGDDLRLLGMPWFSFELKGQAHHRLAEWYKQAKDQAGEKIPVLVWKRTGTSGGGEQWVTMELLAFARMLRLLQQHRDANDVLARALASSFESGLKLGDGALEGEGLVPDSEEPQV